MSRTSRVRSLLSLWVVEAAVVLFAAASALWSEEPSVRAPSDRESTSDVLTLSQWELIDKTVDNGLRFLATQQADDGSFPTLTHAKPGVTSLCVLAFLSRGHLPGEGPYGRHVQRGIEFVLSTQREDGLFTNHPVEPILTSHGVSHAAMYNHGLAGLMLSEVYGIAGGGENDAIRAAIVEGLAFSRRQQLRTRGRGTNEGGFDYLVSSNPGDPNPDLPITACHLSFYRSAKNAGFDVPAQFMQDGLRYVKACYDPKSHVFLYRGRNTMSRGLTASGILALSLAGEHNTQMAREAGQWLRTQSFEQYNHSHDYHDMYFYSAYVCSQAMLQLGGDYWSEFYPPLLKTLARNQRADGSWERSRSSQSGRYGNSYSSSLAILALTPPYQLLPIYQR